MGCIIQEAMEAFSTPLGMSYIRVLEKSDTGDFGSQQMIQLYMEQLLIQLIRSNRPQSKSHNQQSDPLLLLICNYLEKNTEKPLFRAFFCRKEATDAPKGDRCCSLGVFFTLPAQGCSSDPP